MNNEGDNEVIPGVTRLQMKVFAESEVGKAIIAKLEGDVKETLEDIKESFVLPHSLDDLIARSTYASVVYGGVEAVKKLLEIFSQKTKEGE